METRQLCPLCLEAPSLEAPRFDSFDDLVMHFETGQRCDRCGRPVTPEGLGVGIAERTGDVRTVHELGKNGTVIHQYTSRITLIEGDEIGGTWAVGKNEPADFLLSTLLQLKNQCQTLNEKTITPIAAALRWNRKAAARRFRRWAKEHDAPIEVSDPTLAALAEETIYAAALEEVDYSQTIEDTISNKNGAWDRLYDYERRKVEGPVLVLNALPTSTRKLILEANEAYRWGLFTATVAICRSILEDTIKQIIARNPNSLALPIERDDLHILINSLSDKLIVPEERSVALRIKALGNQAMHDGETSFSESRAHAVLFHTSRLVGLLTGRSGKLSNTLER